MNNKSVAKSATSVVTVVKVLEFGFRADAIQTVILLFKIIVILKLHLFEDNIC
jgi:hypothetical protein